MPVIHMTDIAMSALRVPGTYFDESTPAFGIRIGKNRKTWFVVRGRQHLRTNIGRYPATILAEARKEGKKLLLETPTNNPNVKFSAAFDQSKAEHLTRTSATPSWAMPGRSSPSQWGRRMPRTANGSSSSGSSRSIYSSLPNYRMYLKLMIDGMPSRPFSAVTLPPSG